MTNCLPKERTNKDKFWKLSNKLEGINSRAFFQENQLYNLITSVEGGMSQFAGSTYYGMGMVKNILGEDFLKTMFDDIGDTVDVYAIARSRYKVDIDGELLGMIAPSMVLPKDAAIRRIELNKMKASLSNPNSKERKAYKKALENLTDKQKIAIALNYVQTANKIKKNLVDTISSLKATRPQYAGRFDGMTDALNNKHVSFWTNPSQDIDVVLKSYNAVKYIEYHGGKFFEGALDADFFSDFASGRRWRDGMVDNIKGGYSKFGADNKWNSGKFFEVIDRIAGFGTTLFKAQRWISPISYIAMAAQGAQASTRLKLISDQGGEAFDRIRQRLPDSTLISQSEANDISSVISASTTLQENGIINDTTDMLKSAYKRTLGSVQTPQDIVDVVAETSILSLGHQRAVEEMYGTLENFIYRFDNGLISNAEQAETLRLGQLYSNEERGIMRHATLNGTEKTPQSVALKAFNFRGFFGLNKLRTFLKYTVFNVMDNGTKAFIDPNLWQYLEGTAAQIKVMAMLGERNDGNDDDETVTEEILRMLTYSDTFSFLQGTGPGRIFSTAIGAAQNQDNINGARIATAIGKEFMAGFKGYRGALTLDQSAVRQEILSTTQTSISDSVKLFMYGYKDDEFNKAQDLIALDKWYKNQGDAGTMLTLLQNTEAYKFVKMFGVLANNNEYKLTEERAKAIQNSTAFTSTPFSKHADEGDWRGMMRSLSSTGQDEMRKYLFGLYGKSNITSDLAAGTDVGTEQGEQLEDATIYKGNSLSDKEAQKRAEIGIDPKYVISGDYETMLNKIASVNDKDVAAKAKTLRGLSAEGAGAGEIKLKAIQEIMIYRMKSGAPEMFDPNVGDVVSMSTIAERYTLPLTAKGKAMKTPSGNSKLTFDKGDDGRRQLINKAGTLGIEYNHAMQDHILETTVPYMKSANVQKFISVLAAGASMNDSSLKPIINFDGTKVTIENTAAKREIDKILLASVVSRDKPELAMEIYKTRAPSIYITKDDDDLGVTQKVAGYAKRYAERAKIGAMYKEDPSVMIANTLIFAANADARVIKNIYDNREELRKTSPALVSEFEKSMSIMKGQGNEMNDFIKSYLTSYPGINNNKEVLDGADKGGGKGKSIKIGKLKFSIDEIKQAQTKLGNLQFSSPNGTRQQLFTYKPREQKLINSNSGGDKAVSKTYDSAKRQSNAKVSFSLPAAGRRKSKGNKKLGIGVFKF